MLRSAPFRMLSPQSEDKTFIAPPGMWHILLKEKGNEQVGEGAHNETLTVEYAHL